MLPVKGFYMRGGELAVPNSRVKFICACNWEEEMKSLSKKWGFKMHPKKQWYELRKHADIVANREVRLPPHIPDLRFSQTLTKTNRDWLDSLYAEDYAFYEEHCGGTCTEVKTDTRNHVLETWGN